MIRYQFRNCIIVTLAVRINSPDVTTNLCKQSMMVDGFKFRHKYKYKRLHKDFRNTAFLSYLSSMHQNQFMGLADLCDVALSVSKVIIYIYHCLLLSTHQNQFMCHGWLAVPSHTVSAELSCPFVNTLTHTHTYKQTRTRARAVCTQAHTHTSL